MNAADYLRDVPYPSPALIAAHNARQAEHYRYLARCAEQLAAHHQEEGTPTAALLWQQRAESFRTRADQLAHQRTLAEDLAV